jgi:hypothetical protein
MRPALKSPKDLYIEKQINKTYLILTEKNEIQLTYSIQDILIASSILYAHVSTRHFELLNKNSESQSF